MCDQEQLVRKVYKQFKLVSDFKKYNLYIFIRGVLRRMNPNSSRRSFSAKIHRLRSSLCRSVSSMDIRQDATQNPYHNAFHVYDVLERVTTFCKNYACDDSELLPSSLDNKTCQLLQVNIFLNSFFCKEYIHSRIHVFMCIHALLTLVLITPDRSFYA